MRNEHGLAFALICAASLCGCRKSDKVTPSSPPDAGRAAVVSSAPPRAVASSPWLAKNADGTYAIDPSAECVDVLASSPPELALARLEAARGIRATLPAKDTVAIAPLGLRAKLPRGPSGSSWTRVAPSGIAVVRQSDREWEEAYAELLDQALPFESLLFHTSEEPWRESSNVASLSARLYVVTESVEETMKNLRTRLPALGARVACKNRHGTHLYDSPTPVTVATGERGPWKSVRTTMNVWYSDYGGKAVVELFVRRAEPVTLVLALMFEGESRANERNALADSLATP